MHRCCRPEEKGRLKKKKQRIDIVPDKVQGEKIESRDRKLRIGEAHTFMSWHVMFPTDD